MIMSVRGFGGCALDIYADAGNPLAFDATPLGVAQWAVVQWQDSSFWYCLSRFES
jgi:hypothetical protein